MVKTRKKINLTHTRAESSCRPPEFFKVFVPDQSSHQLLIPPAFKKHLEEKVPQKSTIKSSANRTWIVNLEQEGSNLFFKEGWQEFVKYHALDYGDFLIFQYDGNSGFSVKLYSKNGCSKEISVTANCSNPPPEQTPVGEEKKVSWDGRNTTGDPNVKMETPENESLGKQFIQKRKRGRPPKAEQQSFKGLLPVMETPKVQQATRGRKEARPPAFGHKMRKTRGDPNVKMETPENECLGIQFVKKRKKGRPGKAEQHSFEGLVPGRETPKVQQTTSRRKEAKPLAFGRNRTAAIVAADRYECKYPSFKIVLTPSYILKSSMYVPFRFMKNYINGKKIDIYLQVSNRLWPLLLSVYDRPPSCELTTGWRAFLKGNDLHAGDVCIFELIKLDSVTFNVSIFRC